MDGRVGGVQRSVQKTPSSASCHAADKRMKIRTCFLINSKMATDGRGAETFHIHREVLLIGHKGLVPIFLLDGERQDTTCQYFFAQVSTDSSGSFEIPSFQTIALMISGHKTRPSQRTKSLCHSYPLGPTSSWQLPDSAFYAPPRGRTLSTLRRIISSHSQGLTFQNISAALPRPRIPLTQPTVIITEFPSSQFLSPCK
ncbi:hypothetical protein CRENBAI_001463 [Crenichthys baileyi]|uniref:Uncharacterized protein n=1 Tax=Crenichthys baileyi TaxID=28760 RepID=A0AAV9R5Z7_9TELE